MKKRKADALRDEAQQRELAVLVDGPWAPRWYWRDELEQMQAGSTRMGHPDGHPAAQLRAYRPTDQFHDHPEVVGVRGRAWRYVEPTATAVAA